MNESTNNNQNVAEFEEKRKIDFRELVEELRTEQLQKKDLIVPANKIEMIGSDFMIEEKADDGLSGLLSASGIESNPAELFHVKPFMHFHNQVAQRMDIPVSYYNRMLPEENHSLLNNNVNHWLKKAVDKNDNPKSFMIRTFVNPETNEANGRAFLGSRYKIIDNLDILTATLESVRGISGLECTQADVTDTNMYAVFENPNVRIEVPELIENYRNPDDPNNRDTGFISGFTLRNSEVGRGGFQITPRGKFVICGNGMTSNEDRFRKRHVGGKLEEGEIEWSQETMNKNAELIIAQIQDYIKYFTSEEYLRKTTQKLYKAKGLEFDMPNNVVKNVARNHFGFSNDQMEQTLEYFLKGNDKSGLGVIQSFTYFAHETESAELQHDIESEVYDLVPVLNSFDKEYREKK